LVITHISLGKKIDSEDTLKIQANTWAEENFSENHDPEILRDCFKEFRAKGKFMPKPREIKEIWMALKERNSSDCYKLPYDEPAMSWEQQCWLFADKYPPEHPQHKKYLKMAKEPEPKHDIQEIIKRLTKKRTR